MKNILKWITILPASLAVLFVVPYLFYCIQWIGVKYMGGGEDGILLKYITPVIGNLLAGYYYIKSGHAIAPSNKKTVSLILFIIVLLISGCLFFVNIMQKEYLMTIESIAVVICSSIAFIEIERGTVKS